MEAAQMTLVEPSVIKAEPSAYFMKARSIATGRNSVGVRPSALIIPTVFSLYRNHIPGVSSAALQTQTKMPTPRVERCTFAHHDELADRGYVCVKGLLKGCLNLSFSRLKEWKLLAL